MYAEKAENYKERERKGEIGAKKRSVKKKRTGTCFDGVRIQHYGIKFAHVHGHSLLRVNRGKYKLTHSRCFNSSRLLRSKKQY